MNNKLINLSHLRTTTDKLYKLIIQTISAVVEALDDFGSKLPSKRQILVALSDWIGDGPYTQTVHVDGVSSNEAEQLIYIVPASSDLEEWETSEVKCVKQDNESLTFYAKNKPTKDLSIFVIMQEV